MEVAALGLRIDGIQNIDAASQALDNFTSASGKAEGAASGVGKTTGRATTEVGKFTKGAGGAAAAANDFNAGALAAGRGVDALGRNTAGASRSLLDFVKSARGAYTALAALATAGAAKALITYADTWSDLQSKVGAATGDMSGAGAMMSRLVEIANASYSSLDQTASAYASNVGTLQALGKSAQEAADYTESLNHMLVLTATRGQQAESVQNALSKAMAVGKLQADGLETVLANGGEVANALAAGLGVTVSELRGLASQGKITSQVIADSIIKPLESVRERAGEMPATIGDAFTRINTRILQFVGTLDKATGASAAVSGALMGAADALVPLGAALLAAGGYITRAADGLSAIGKAIRDDVLANLSPLMPALNAVGSVFSWIADQGDIALVALGGFASPILIAGVWSLAAALTTGVVAGVRAVTAAMLANPIGLLVAALAAAVYAAYKFRDEISQVLGFDIVEVAKTGANYVIGALVGAYEAISALWGNFGDVMEGAMIGAVNAVIRQVNNMVTEAVAGINVLIGLVNEVPGVSLGNITGGALLEEMDNPAAARVAEAWDKLWETLSTGIERDYLGQAGAALSGTADDADALATAATAAAAPTQQLSEEAKKAAKALKDFLDGERRAAEGANAMAAAYLAGGDAVSQMTRQLRIEAEVLRHGETARRRITDAVTEHSRALDRQDMSKQLAQLEQQNRAAAAYTAVLHAQSQGIEAGAAALEIYNQQQAMAALLAGRTADEVADLIIRFQEQWAIQGALTERNEGVAELNRLIDSTRTRQERYNAELSRLERLRGIAETTEQVEALDRATLKLHQDHSEWHQFGLQAIDALDKGFQDMWQSFGDDSMSVFDSVKKGFKSMMANLAHQAITQPIIVGLTSGWNGTVGGGSAPGAAGGGGIGVGNLISGAQTAWSIATGGMTASLASGISSIGSAIGSSAVQSFALGMQGNTLAAGLAGPTTAGAGGAMGAGAAFASAVPWIAGALAVYTIASSLMSAPEKRFGGSYMLDDQGNAVRTGGPSGNLGEGALRFSQGLLDTATDAITRGFQGAGIDAALNNLTATFESSEKGRGGVSSFVDVVIDGETYRAGAEGKGAGHGGTDGTIEEMMQNVQTDTYQTVIQAWQTATDRFPTIIQDMLKGVHADDLELGDAQNFIQTVLATLDQLNALKGALDALPFVPATNATLTYADALARATGGAEAAMNGLASYYQNYYTEIERTTWLTEQLTKDFSSLGFELPKTRQEMRDLMEQQMALGEESIDTVAALLSLENTLSSILPEFEALDASLPDPAKIAAMWNLTDPLGTFGREVESLSDQFTALGVEMPRTVGQFQAMVLAAGALGDEGSDLYKALLDLTPAMASFTGGMTQRQDAFWNLVAPDTAFQRQQSALREQFNALGLEMPRTTGAFRDLVLGAQAMGDESGDLYYKLLDLTPAMSAYLKGLDDQKNALNSTASALSDARSAAASGVSSRAYDLRENILVDQLGSDEARYGYFKAQADQLAALLPSLTSIDAITETANRIYDLTNSAYGLLDEEQRSAQAVGTTDFISGVEKLALEAIETATLEQTKQNAKIMEDAINRAMEKAVANMGVVMTSAGGDIKESARLLEVAAQQIRYSGGQVQQYTEVTA